MQLIIKAVDFVLEAGSFLHQLALLVFNGLLKSLDLFERVLKFRLSICKLLCKLTRLTAT
jgi:hypothetical protein